MRSSFVHSSLCLLIIITLLGGGYATAQRIEKSRTSYGWLGTSIGKSDLGILFDASFVSLEENQIIGMRYTYSEEVQICIFGCDKYPSRVWDVGLLYGIGNNVGEILTYSATGISVVGYGVVGSNLTTIGIPLDFRIIHHGKYFGIGLGLSGNINLKAPFYAISISIQMGDFQ